MATYYWVGDNTAWDDVTTSNWATSTDGTPGAGVPTSLDNVVFDSTTKKVNGIAANVICNNLTATYNYMVAAGSLYLYNGSYAVNVYGNFSVGTTISNTTLRRVDGYIAMRSTSTGNSVALGDLSPYSSLYLNFDGVGGTWLLSGTNTNIPNAISYAYSITVTNGTLSFNDTFPQIKDITQTGGTIDWSGRTLSIERFTRSGGSFLNSSSSTVYFVDLDNYYSIAVSPTYQGVCEAQLKDTSSEFDTYPNLKIRANRCAKYTFYLELSSSKYAESLDFDASGGSQGVVAFITGNCSSTAKIGVNGGGTISMRSCVIDGFANTTNSFGFHVSSTSTCEAVECIINPNKVTGVTLVGFSKYGIVRYDRNETSFKLPADFNPANNKIYLFGAGGGGSAAINDNGSSGSTRASGAGGGGGGVTIIENFAGVAGSTYYYSIGKGGNGAGYGSGSGVTSTGTAGGDTTFNSGTYTAGGGGGGTTSLTASTPGAGGVGTSFSGGSGGAGIVYTSGIFDGIPAGGGGGGGAAGTGGNGGAGGDGNKTSGLVALGGAGGGAGTVTGAGYNAADASTTAAGVGGNSGNNTGGGAAGTSTTPINDSNGFAGGGAGGPYGTTNSSTVSRTALGGNYAYSSTDIAPVGGGGGSSSHGDFISFSSSTSTPAGLFGGGGGGGSHGTSYGQTNSGAGGADGAIILTYVPATTITNAGGMFLLI